MSESSGVNPAGSSGNTNQNQQDNLNIPDAVSKEYPSNRAPAIKKWLEKWFPDMSKPQLDKATSQFIMTEMQFLSSVQKRLEKQRKEAAKRMKKSIEGQD